FRGEIVTAQGHVGEGFDLSPSLAALDALAAALESFHAGIEAGTVSSDAANRAIKDLARVLVPVSFTRGPRFSHDPALNIPPLPGIADAKLWPGLPVNQRGFLQAQLMRGQNRLIDALERAADLLP
ncbi:MAG: hypothetical protein ACK4GT_18005, partial [Pararhodobacter sp.]